MTVDVRAFAIGAMFVAATTGAAPPKHDAQADHVRSIAATCAACHGTDGAAVPGEAMPVLAGYPKEAFVTQLKAFRDGTRTATVMHQIVRGYSDEDIDALASWFASRRGGAR